MQPFISARVPQETIITITGEGVDDEKKEAGVCIRVEEQTHKKINRLNTHQ